MPQSDLPVLYTFRRCPYAMRARLALAAAQQAYQPIEVVLRDKPAALLRASPKGTVPVLILPSGEVIDESLNIMLWALHQHDPQQWLMPSIGSLSHMLEAIGDLDKNFKPLLDRCKYPDRYPDVSLDDSRARALQWLVQWEKRLQNHAFLFGTQSSLADVAMFPFVRQFAAIDTAWWDAQALPHLQQWRTHWLNLPLFACVMQKPQSPSGKPF
ncbi:glutathione S-transferase [Lampropedia puyangensis]|uniref:Glutathione S-transferase n=2 Tax=Lampropedia puyangensis TaxID=1330072 RepID=A0A4S8F9N0_9BURK|nr:glutathione S-transferase [Lampropedia puyangensis]